MQLKNECSSVKLNDGDDDNTLNVVVTSNEKFWHDKDDSSFMQDAFFLKPVLEAIREAVAQVPGEKNMKRYGNSFLIKEINADRDEFERYAKRFIHISAFGVLGETCEVKPLGANIFEISISGSVRHVQVHFEKSLLSKKSAKQKFKGLDLEYAGDVLGCSDHEEEEDDFIVWSWKIVVEKLAKRLEALENLDKRLEALDDAEKCLKALKDTEKRLEALGVLKKLLVAQHYAEKCLEALEGTDKSLQGAGKRLKRKLLCNIDLLAKQTRKMKKQRK